MMMFMGVGSLVQHSPLVLIRQTKLNGPLSAFHAAISHKAGACEDTTPWGETKDESQKVYLVLGLEVMGELQGTWEMLWLPS